jgi:hypothetical protein
MCDFTGQMIPFVQTKADRLASGDPRLSVAERYPSHDAYVTAVTQASNHLYDGRLLLAEDVQAFISAAAASTVANDTTPPVLTVPSNITTEATGPGGTAVTFSATATDNWDPNPVVACIPASGSTLAIGTTIVNCSATDATGNAANTAFTVHVKGATEQLADLAAAATGVGPGKSLIDKVTEAQADLDANDLGGTCGGLGAFVKEVKAQTGKKILPVSAASLTSAATRIEAVLAC